MTEHEPIFIDAQVTPDAFANGEIGVLKLCVGHPDMTLTGVVLSMIRYMLEYNDNDRIDELLRLTLDNFPLTEEDQAMLADAPYLREWFEKIQPLIRDEKVLVGYYHVRSY